MPGQLNNYLAYKLAGMLGLITPHAEMVNLRVNGNYRGVHLLLEQLRELTLRRNNRMPGDLYVGELVGRDSYRDLPQRVFEYPGLWEKVAYNNHYPRESFKPLKHFVQLLNSDHDEETYKQMFEMIDLEMWARFSALEILVQTYHYVNSHNWRLYYDPVKNTFEPVVWDPGGWYIHWRPTGDESAQLDIITSQLHEVLVRNYQFLLSRYRTIDDFYRSGLDKRFLMEVDNIIAKMNSAIDHDYNIVYDFRVISPEESREAMNKLSQSIKSIFDDVRNGYTGGSGSVKYAAADNVSLQFLIDGRRPVEQLQLNYLRPIENKVKANIAFWVDGKRKEVDISDAVSFSGSSLLVNVPLLAQHVPVRVGNHFLKSRRLEIRPAYYELILEGGTEGNVLESVFAYRGGEIPEKAGRLEHLDKKEFHNSYGIIKPHPVTFPEIWKGDITIEGVRTIRNNLIIKAGTTVKMDEGASLIIHGRLTAEGTEQNPVSFIPARKNQEPWGAVVLRGGDASGSRLRHCEFSGGSGLKGDLFEYSAMLSVRDVKDVRVDRCYFHDNKIVDDMVHAAYADITFTNSVFERSHSDALDIDIGKVVIERSVFLDSGNDAVDLMTSEAFINETLMKRNSDKGISVGEQSSLFLINSRLVQNEVGLQSKDNSIAVLYNVDLEKNRKALDAYKKNWRYGKGGMIRLYKGRVSGNENTFNSDKKSYIWVYDSYVKGEITESKRIRIDTTVDSLNDKEARIKKLWKHPDEAGGPDSFDQYWSRANPQQRGAVRFDY